MDYYGTYEFGPLRDSVAETSDNLFHFRIVQLFLVANDDFCGIDAGKATTQSTYGVIGPYMQGQKQDPGVYATFEYLPKAIPCALDANFFHMERERRILHESICESLSLPNGADYHNLVQQRCRDPEPSLADMEDG
jgi:hypothetical protein